MDTCRQGSRSRRRRRFAGSSPAVKGPLNTSYAALASAVLLHMKHVFAEVPMHHFHRAYGKSQFFNFPRIWRTGVNILGFWWRLNGPGRGKRTNED